MEINAEFDRRVVVHSDALEWLSSPMAGVERRPLDRVGGEVARATSVVRYAPGSNFSPHVHGGGEEFLVLDGVFQDEHGDFPTGSYVRNPPETRHTPRSDRGCTVLVKLWQFQPHDRIPVCVNIDHANPVPHRDHCGIAVIPLFADDREEVSIVHFEPAAAFGRELGGGAEMFVLAGGVEERGDTLGRHGWLRLPPGERLEAVAGPDGARIWLKTGHLASAAAEVARVRAV